MRNREKWKEDWRKQGMVREWYSRFNWEIAINGHLRGSILGMIRFVMKKERENSEEKVNWSNTSVMF